MSTKKQLVSRWLTPDGEQRCERIHEALRRRSPNVAYKSDTELGPKDTGFALEIRAIVAGMPLAEEVAPDLDLRGIEFESASWIRNLDLSGARLDNAIFATRLSDSIVRHACMDYVDCCHGLSGDFTGTTFRRAKLNGAGCHRTVFVDCDFTGANLNRTHLEEADCRRAKFIGAKLRSAFCPRADFRGADFSGADLSHATLGGIRVDETTIFKGTILNGSGMEAKLQQWAFQAGAIVDEASSMLDVVCTSTKASSRKLRLFAVACVRRFWEHIKDIRSRQALELAEDCADGRARDRHLASAAHSAHQAVLHYLQLSGDGAPGSYDFCNYAHAACAGDAQAAARAVLQMGPVFAKARLSSMSDENVLRDIFGEPSRALPRITRESWNDGTVSRLAQAIYDERAFDRMPILADALEEAGCTDQDIIEHCRGPGPHVRGCWVVDLLLGKE